MIGPGLIRFTFNVATYVPRKVAGILINAALDVLDPADDHLIDYRRTTK